MRYPTSVVWLRSFGPSSDVPSPAGCAALVTGRLQVGVDAKCFVDKCSLQTKGCLNNPDCLKGLSCLSK